MSKSILVINQDQKIIDIWKEQLNQIGEFEVVLESSFFKCQEKFRKKNFDLLVLDEQSSESEIKKIFSKNANIHLISKIIILQNKNSQIKKLSKIENFAQNVFFIQKPFKLFDFFHNVNSILKKPIHSSLKMNENIMFLENEKTLKDKKGKDLIKLTDKETLILKQMIIFKGKTISKNNLLKSVWGYRQDISTSTVETHIYRLRKKLYKVFPNKTIIFTSNKGYKFSGF